MHRISYGQFKTNVTHGTFSSGINSLPDKNSDPLLSTMSFVRTNRNMSIHMWTSAPKPPFHINIHPICTERLMPCLPMPTKDRVEGSKLIVFASGKNATWNTSLRAVPHNV
ncbi:hypothetical protein XENTR_v10000546 [Xenopus tropicalis]|nr:hypothetical protein XENTR_v10000546 [Xenopus tropicalis]